MNRLAQAMCRLAQDKGAQVRFRAKAARIEQQGDRVTAVHLEDGSRLPADLIVFNGDPKALVDGHLGQAASRGRAAQGRGPTAACRPLSGGLPQNPQALNWRITTCFSALIPSASSTIWPPGACPQTARFTFALRTGAALRPPALSGSRSS